MRHSKRKKDEKIHKSCIILMSNMMLQKAFPVIQVSGTKNRFTKKKHHRLLIERCALFLSGPHKTQHFQPKQTTLY